MSKKYNFPETIVTDRFILESISPMHAEEAYEVIDKNREHISEFLDWLTPEYNLDDTIKFYEIQQENFQNQDSFEYMIIDKETDNVIGSVGLVIKGVDKAAFGYWLDSAQQGRGVMHECVETLKDIAFNENSFIRLDLHTLPDNTKSQKVALKAGFIFDSLIYSHRVNMQGNLEDVYQFVCLKDKQGMDKLSKQSKDITKAFGVSF